MLGFGNLAVASSIRQAAVVCVPFCTCKELALGLHDAPTIWQHVCLHTFTPRVLCGC